MMNWFKALFGDDSSAPPHRENVVLLVRDKHRNGSETDHRLIVERSEIDQICQEHVNDESVVEVWVYQKIFHHQRSENDDAVGDAALLASGALPGLIKE